VLARAQSERHLIADVQRADSRGVRSVGGDTVRAAAREKLPNRRFAETRDLQVGGLRYTATLGFYPDGRIGEIFLTNHKAGSQAGVPASDSAVLCSLLLQHGVPVGVTGPARRRKRRRARSRTTAGSRGGIVADERRVETTRLNG